MAAPGLFYALGAHWCIGIPDDKNTIYCGHTTNRLNWYGFCPSLHGVMTPAFTSRWICRSDTSNTLASVSVFTKRHSESVFSTCFHLLLPTDMPNFYFPKTRPRLGSQAPPDAISSGRTYYPATSRPPLSRHTRPEVMGKTAGRKAPYLTRELRRTCKLL